MFLDRFARNPRRLLVTVILLPLLALAPTAAPSLSRAHAQSSGYPNDPLFQFQWNLHNTGQDAGIPGNDIHLLDAWHITHCSPNVTIADIDTGVDVTHPDLAGKVVQGAAFGTGDASVADDSAGGHGTWIAGIIGAATDNGIGIAGVCPLGKIMPIKIAGIESSSEDHINSFRVAKGIRWAVNHGAHVVSMSIGVDDSSQLDDAVNYAYGQGVLLVAAAGNSGDAFTVYPGDLPHVLVVGGTDAQGMRWLGSSWGPNHDFVLAPALGITSTTPKRNYSTYAGTSGAAPQVAGLAGLILSVRPDLTVDQVVAAIEQGADPVQGQAGWDQQDGYGRINCYRSLVIAQSMARVTPLATPGPTDTPTPPLTVTAQVTTKRLKPKQKQTLTVTGPAAANVVVEITYSNTTVTDRTGTLGSTGQYRYTWRVLRSRGTAFVQVTVTTDEGDVAIRKLTFRIR